MAGTDDHRESMGVDRRASTRLSMQQIQPHDDDYDLEAMGISDGFRPGGFGMGHNRMSSQTSQNNHLTAGRRTPPPRPSSTTKPKPTESFDLRHDGGMGDLRRNSGIASTANAMGPTRSSSVSTDLPYVRPESPYRGPAGPSHPYQMYPQESRLARTASIATTATAPPVAERSYAGPSGPTHPYGMYPQNIASEPESSQSPSPAPSVPVGFPGLNNNYQRRLGPDGEEVADIIGPDGHTEQLPPYTQYPDEAFARKTRPTIALPIAAGAGGMGLATRNPEFASQENLNSPASRGSIMSELSNQPVINTAAATVSEKPELNKWQKLARRKLWGVVPVWVLVLVVIMFIIFGIILASVLAALAPKHPPPKHEQANPHTTTPQGEVYYTTMTTTFDATPFSALPTGISALPTGTFVLPVNVPSASQKSCLINSAQSNTWSCSVPMTPGPLQIATTSSQEGTTPLTNNQINLNFGNNSGNALYSWAYGAQAPVLPSPQGMKLVTDSDEPEKGPAWWFQLPYNKLVILRETDLVASTTKRDVAERGWSGGGDGGGGGSGNGNGNGNGPGDFQRKGVAQPGEKPWFCYWNGTLLEAFIYVNQTSAAGSQASAASASSLATSSSAAPSNSQSATGTYTSSVPTSNVQSQGSSYSGSSAPPNFPPAYPRVVKLEERRIPKGPSVSPYCVQHIVQSDGSAIPFMNSTNLPVTVYLNETMPTSVTRRDYDDQSLYGRDSTDQCGCTWEWT